MRNKAASPASAIVWNGSQLFFTDPKDATKKLKPNSIDNTVTDN